MDFKEIWIDEWLKLLPELCGDLLDGSILGLGNFPPNVENETYLHDNENDKNVGAHRKLKWNSFLMQELFKKCSSVEIRLYKTEKTYSLKNGYLDTNF